MRAHSKDTEISVDGTDLTTHTNTSTMTRGAGTQNLTTYGSDDEVHGGTLKNGRYVMGGVYEAQATSGSPRSVLKGHESETMQIIRKPEGTGTGKPTETFDAVLTSYVESAPVADHITWSAEFTKTGAIVDTVQS